MLSLTVTDEAGRTDTAPIIIERGRGEFGGTGHRRQHRLLVRGELQR